MNDPLITTLLLLFLGVLCCLLLVFLAVNIWQRHQAEETLRKAYASLEQRVQQRAAEFQESEAQFRLMAETASDLLYEWDIRTDHLRWFGDIDAALGFAQGEFPHTLEAWQNRIHPQDISKINTLIVHHREHGDALHVEYRIQGKEGRWRYWVDRGAALFDDSGQPYKLVGSCSDVTHMRQYEQALRDNELKYRTLIESLGSEYFFYRHDIRGVFTYVSPSVKQVLGYSQAEFLLHYATYLSDNQLNLKAKNYSQLSIQGQKQPPYELEAYHKNGHLCRLRVTEFPVFAENGHVEAVQGVAQDVSLQHQARLMQNGRTQVLEMIAKKQPLSDILHALVKFLESVHEGMLISIMLYDAESSTLSLGAAPSLPDFYNQAVDGIKIVDGMGACGAAVTRGERVVTEDILQHPYWADFRELMEKTPLRSCWSEPIHSSNGQVLGAFAVYYRTPRVPTDIEQQLIQTAVSLAAIAIDQQRNLQALQDSEKRLTTLIEALPDAVYFKDGQGHWQVVNAAGLQAFGLHGQAWQGKTDLDLAVLQPHLRETHENCYASDERVWQQGCCSQLEEIMQDEQGNTHYFAMTKVPLFNPRKEREGLVIIGRDVSQQRRMEETVRENQRYLQLALNATGAGTFLYDAVTNINIWDVRSEEIFGLPPGSFAGTYEAWRAYVHPNDLPATERILQQALNEADSFDLEYRILQPSGAIRQVQAQAWILRDAQGSVTKVSGLHFDITRRKQAEAELEQAKDHAEAANRAKTAFLANMSHELRTPLSSILGYAHILQQQLLSKGQQEQLRGIRQNGESLLLLINNILDLSKIETGKIALQISDFSLPSFFQEISHFFSQVAAQKNLEFVYEPELCAQTQGFPGLVKADEKRLRQILSNLLSNAIKFTEQGSVNLSVQYCDAAMRVSITDTGLGIATEDLPLLFRPFQQFNRQYYQPGTGLGLVITQKLLKLMDAQFTVESQLNRGSCFTFKLPLEVLSWETDAENTLPTSLKAYKTSVFAKLTGEQLQLPQQTLNDLRKMAELGDVTAILDAIEPLQERAKNAEQAFYAHLLHLAQNFRVAELQHFLQQCG